MRNLKSSILQILIIIIFAYECVKNEAGIFKILIMITN